MAEDKRPPDKSQLLAKKKEFLIRAKQAGAFSLKPEDITASYVAIRLAGSALLGGGAAEQHAGGLIQWADSDSTDPYVGFDMDSRDRVMWADMDPTDNPRRLDRDPTD